VIRLLRCWSTYEGLLHAAKKCSARICVGRRRRSYRSYLTCRTDATTTKDTLKTVICVYVPLLTQLQTAGMRTLTVITSVLLVGSLASSARSQTQSKEPTSEEVSGKAVLTVAPKTFPTPNDSLKNARTIYVKSSSLLVGSSVVEDKLKKRKEFEALGLSITRDAAAADLILHVEHDLFTMYTYTVLDPHSQILVATGKLSSLGGTVAGKVAKRFMKQMVEARVR